MADSSSAVVAGRYRVLGNLGKGAMGLVYMAYDPVLDRKVAIKQMTAEIADNEELRQRFYVEARAAARLNHPNIITIHELQESGGDIFMIMELLEGKSLAALILAKPVPLSIEATLDVMAQVCDGLDYAHQRTIVHRDIKPANLILTPAGTVKILDFGIARLGSLHMTAAGALIGTPDYMSPEQIRGDEIDRRTDLWAVGAVLYQLLSGAKPFEGKPLARLLSAIAQTPHVPLAVRAPSVPKSVSDLVDRLLVKPRDGRPASAAIVRDELRAILGRESSSSTKATLAEDEYEETVYMAAPAKPAAPARPPTPVPPPAAAPPAAASAAEPPPQVRAMPAPPLPNGEAEIDQTVVVPIVRRAPVAPPPVPVAAPAPAPVSAPSAPPPVAASSSPPAVTTPPPPAAAPKAAAVPPPVPASAQKRSAAPPPPPVPHAAAAVRAQAAPESAPKKSSPILLAAAALAAVGLLAVALGGWWYLGGRAASTPAPTEAAPAAAAGTPGAALPASTPGAAAVPAPAAETQVPARETVPGPTPGVPAATAAAGGATSGRQDAAPTTAAPAPPRPASPAPAVRPDDRAATPRPAPAASGGKREPGIDSGVSAAPGGQPRPGVSQDTVDAFKRQGGGLPSESSQQSVATLAAVNRINYILEQYVQALVNADADAIRDFRPNLSVEEATLMKARQLRVRLEDVRVEVNGSEAVARCRRKVEGTGPTGVRIQDDSPATFRLTRRASGWIITDVSR
jgi:eukaryotic-like serine/threonine-protein kinase